MFTAFAAYRALAAGGMAFPGNGGAGSDAAIPAANVESGPPEKWLNASDLARPQASEHRRASRAQAVLAQNRKSQNEMLEMGTRLTAPSSALVGRKSLH